MYAKQIFYLLYYIPIYGRGGIWTHELDSQDLASLHNNHSVTRPYIAHRIRTYIFSFEDQRFTIKLELLLTGIEPIFPYSQYGVFALLNYKSL